MTDRILAVFRRRFGNRDAENATECDNGPLDCLKSSKTATLSVFFMLTCDSMTVSFVLLLLPSLLLPYHCKTFYSDFNSSEAHFTDDYVERGPSNMTYTKCDDVAISQRVGLLSGVGPVAEVIACPLMGYLITLFGARLVYRFGWLMSSSGILVWLLVNSEWGLFAGRTLQSIGSTVSIISGLSYLGERFSGNEQERIRALGRAHIGFAFGYLIGYIPGTLLYQVAGLAVPLLVVLTITLPDMSLRCFLPPIRDIERNSSGRILRYVLTDPYIILAVILTFVAYSPRGVTIATVPKWLADVHSVAHWQIGLFYTVAAASEATVQTIATHLVGGHQSRCVILFTAFCFHTVGLATMPFIPNSWLAIVPLSLVRIGEGLYGTMITSLLSYIADKRGYQYNIVYSGFVLTYTSAIGISPIVCGYLVPVVGFQTLYLMWAGIALVSAFPTVIMNNVRAREASPTESLTLIRQSESQSTRQTVSQTENQID